MQFANTSTNMAQVVSSIIDGYRMGALRALAQEPVQNALDAKRDGQGRVAVEYRLLRREMPDGRGCYLLTVTDTGTTGLRGPLVSNEELEGRDFKLRPEENWAAFEGHGYTKENEDALGSRGQGKAAFLYHSHVPGKTRRMAMLYDTRLEGGEYRLGMRFARPVDQILTPPLYNDEAKAAIQNDAFPLEGDLAIPLGLKPLRDIGTRVIVPFLDEGAVGEIKPGGELSRWLQRCWWRAIQLGKLAIRVVDDESGDEESIQPPDWWQNLPRSRGKPPTDGKWFDLLDGGRACEWRNCHFGDKQKIHRLVLLHSEDLPEDEISDQPEWSGIQLLRGKQWIETYGAKEEYGDFIPAEKRGGFRGYVEFAEHTERALRHREVESSQHDYFNRRKKIISNIRALLRERVRDFSHEMGWLEAADTTQQAVSQREKDTHMRFLETFLNPSGRKPKTGTGKGEADGEQLLWDLRLDLDYPDPKSARVDWGQSIRRVYVEAGCEPGDELMGSADLILEWVDDRSKSRTLLKKEAAIGTGWGEGRIQEQFELGDWQILRGKGNNKRQIGHAEKGEYQLRARIEYRGELVKRAARTVYVQTEPPPPPEKNPITLSISVTNVTDGEKKRIDHGEVLQVDIFSRNYLPEDLSVTLLASADFEDTPYARGMPVDLKGSPAGDTPSKKPILTIRRQLLEPQRLSLSKREDIAQVTMPEASGIFSIRAELHDGQGKLLANARQPLHFQRDPGRAKDRLPFVIEQVSGQKEMWKLNEELSELTYPGDYPLRKELPDVKRQGRPLQGKNAFIAEISANGLLEWALRPKLNDGDDSNYDQLLETISSPDDPEWEGYIRKLDNLGKGAEAGPLAFAETCRETVAIMLDIFSQEKD